MSHKPEDLYEVGIAAKVTQVLSIPDESLRVELRGIARVRVAEYLQTDPFFRVRVEFLPKEEDTSREAQEVIRRVIEQLKQIQPGLIGNVRHIDEAGLFADVLTPQLTLEIAAQQEILQTVPPRQRLEKLSALLGQGSSG